MVLEIITCKETSRQRQRKVSRNVWTRDRCDGRRHCPHPPWQ